MLDRAGSGERSAVVECCLSPRSDSIPGTDVTSPSGCFRQTVSGAFWVDMMLPVIALLRSSQIIIPVWFYQRKNCDNGFKPAKEIPVWHRPRVSLSAIMLNMHAHVLFGLWQLIYSTVVALIIIAVCDKPCRFECIKSCMSKVHLIRLL